MKLKPLFNLSCLFLFLFLLPLVVNAFEPTGLPPANTINAQLPELVKNENNPSLEPLYIIYIENTEQGLITKLNKFGELINLGKVLKPATKIKDSNGFWAAHYVKANNNNFSAVDAIGVNAIHCVVTTQNYDPANYKKWPAMIFSLGIKEDYQNALGTYNDSMIYTNIPGGTDLFGGDSSPFVGNPIECLTTKNQWVSLEQYFNNDFSQDLPQKFRIIVSRPNTDLGFPDYLEFENWASADVVQNQVMPNNGQVLVHYPGNQPIPIASVMQRVSATGRFVGSEYAGLGTLRANHGGVICLSTIPYTGYLGSSMAKHNQRGGFQIIPANHAKFLQYNLNIKCINKPQYMIISYLGADKNGLSDPNYVVTANMASTPNSTLSYSPFWEGVAPLFASYLQPHKPNSWQSDTIGNNIYFLVSSDFGKTWQTCPEIHGIQNIPENWTNIRIYLAYDRGLLSTNQEFLKQLE
ncbi:MAG: hypothetical protein WC860_07165 [Candidatus Margulisiibacteriota bacterium]|jgi:hypothetical protein